MSSIAAKVKVDIVRAMVVELGGRKLIYVTEVLYKMNWKLRIMVQSSTMVKYSTMIKYTVCLLIQLTYCVRLKFPVSAGAQTSSRYVYVQTQPMLWSV